MSIKDTFLKHGWNVFNKKEPYIYYGYGETVAIPSKNNFVSLSDRSVVASVYTRLSVDAASMEIIHAKLDDDDRYTEQMPSRLNYCLTNRANIDQTGRALIQDAILTLLTDGCAALVPIDTTIDPEISGSYDISSLRVGKITQWYPQHVRVNIYNEATGKREDKTLSKNIVALPINPFYNIMNEPNSTLKRLNRKISLLDYVDEQSRYGKLDLIVQLPYSVRSELRKKEAANRRNEIQEQLSDSKYGIAYIDATEKVTQLNRPVENTLADQVTTLTKMLFSQLGITEEILNGTADEGVMANYYSRTVEPIVSAIVDEMNTKFLTKTARTQHQAIIYYRDPFKLVPVSTVADMADKFTRNEILSSNEFRGIVGRKPVNDPKADALLNKNINHGSNEIPEGSATNNQEKEESVSEDKLKINEYKKKIDDLISNIKKNKKEE